MTMSLQAVALDSPICKALPALPEKFIVDFVNGIDVAREHVRVQRGRDSFFSRMYDGFTGQGMRRQSEINTSLAEGLDASLCWLGELTDSVARSYLAITEVNSRVTRLTQQVTALAGYSADTRKWLQKLAESTDRRLQGLEQEVAHIGLLQAAQLNIEAAFSRWKTGGLGFLSPAARCYATLEALRWGRFGDYLRSNVGDSKSSNKSELLQIVVGETVLQLTSDLHIDKNSRINMDGGWLKFPGGKCASGREDWQAALAYLADGMFNDGAPFVHSAIEGSRAGRNSVPLFTNAQRIAEAMMLEVFPKEASHV